MFRSLIINRFSCCQCLFCVTNSYNWPFEGVLDIFQRVLLKNAHKDDLRTESAERAWLVRQLSRAYRIRQQPFSIIGIDTSPLYTRSSYNTSCCLADNLHVSDDGVPSFSVCCKGIFILIFHVEDYLPDSIQDVIQIKAIICMHRPLRV